MPERPPEPTGPSVPVNSTATTEMLAHNAGLVVVGPKRDVPEVKQQVLSRQLFRRNTRDQYARVPGAQLIERTIYVPFDYGSDKFLPTMRQRLYLKQLLAVADRVEVRGRTDGRGNKKTDERMAHQRAESAKRYLLDRGVPGNIIAVNYQAAGDYIADNESIDGRNMNRRVEIEFYIDDFTQTGRVENAITEPHKCQMPANVNDWQTVGDSSDCIN